MRKILLLLVVAAFGVVLFGSCKSTHDCPAYSNIDTTELEKA